MTEYFSNTWAVLFTIAIGMKVSFKHFFVTVTSFLAVKQKNKNLLRQLRKQILLLLIIFVLTINFSFAQEYQWTHTSLDSGVIHNILIYDSTKIYAATNSGIYFTSDYGDNWIIKNNGLGCEPFNLIRDKLGNLYTAGLGGIFKSTNQGDSWLSISDSFTTNEFYSIVLTRNETLIAGCFLGIFFSSNHGNTWAPTNYTHWGILEIISFCDSLVFAASNTLSFSGIFISTDDGKIWDYSAGLSTHTLININDSVLFCGSQFPAGIFLSADSGNSWNPTNHFQDAFDLTDFTIDKNGNLYVSVIYSGSYNLCDIYKSDDLGLNWIQLGLSGKEIYALAIDFLGTIYAGSNDGIYKYDKIVPVELTLFTAETEENGIILKWITASETNNLGFEIERKKQVGDWMKIVFLKGAGTTSLPNNYFYKDKLMEAGKYYYRIKQLDYEGNFKYYQSIEVNFESIDEYILYQNYPNPFNAETIIKYHLPYDSSVKLYVTNSLGETVESVVNNEQRNGLHEIRWRKDNLPSGIYILILEANSFKCTNAFRGARKILLIK